MENFCFPNSPESNNYHNLETVFEILKREYISFNGIDSDNNIDIQKNISESVTFYELFRSNVNVALSILFDHNQEINKFNLEELFLINRMAFLRFKRVGANLTVFDLYENLKILQVRLKYKYI